MPTSVFVVMSVCESVDSGTSLVNDGKCTSIIDVASGLDPSSTSQGITIGVAWIPEELESEGISNQNIQTYRLLGETLRLAERKTRGSKLLHV